MQTVLAIALHCTTPCYFTGYRCIFAAGLCSVDLGVALVGPRPTTFATHNIALVQLA